MLRPISQEAARALLSAVEDLDLKRTFKDSHSTYYTFNVDQANTLRAAIAKAEVNHA